MSFADPTRVNVDDRLIVFFAGHGHTVTGSRGDVGFLVPFDGNPAQLQTLIRWDEFTRNADLIPAKHVLFLMDACYGGLALVRTPTFGAMRFMKDMLQRRARQVLTAGKADETVADGSGVRPHHSIFTAHLLNALEGDAATGDGIITANGVMAYVYERVGRDQYSHQTPHYGFVEGDGDLIFDASVLEKLTVARPAAGTGTEAPDVLINPAGVVVSSSQHEPRLVEQLKEMIPDPAKRIKLHDFVAERTREFLDTTDLRHFPVQGVSVTREQLADRIAQYELQARPLQQVAIVLATWADSSQTNLLEKIFVRLAEADKGGAGLVAWIKLTWYPFVYLLYSAGIAALAAERFDVLASLFHAKITSDTAYGEKSRPLAVTASYRATDLNEYFKLLPGHERHFVPRSEYLFKALQPTLEDLLMLGRKYEPLFDQFEVLLALEHADLTDGDWGPPGRFAWKHREGDLSPLTQVIQEAENHGSGWAPFRAGLFRGSPERLKHDADLLKSLLQKLSWF
jgi:hypothetical protein